MKALIYNSSWVKPLIFMLLLGAFTPVFAQHNCNGSGNSQERKEKLKSLKVAFLTNQLSLTTAEAEKFWPIYNEYQDKLMELHAKKVDLVRSHKDNLDALSDAQITDYVNALLAFKQDELDIEYDYLNRIKKVLPIQKVALLLRAEHEFKKELMRQYQDRQCEKPVMPGAKP